MRVVVEVTRGPVVESRHDVSVAVSDASGSLRAMSGDPSLIVFARSAVKPLQALPAVAAGALERFGWGDDELALMCASHGGELRHVAIARRMLDSLGVSEDELACGPHWPMTESAAAELRGRGERPARVHNNCSGKHAGMMALAVVSDWPVAGYHDAGHPVQQRLRDEIAAWCGVPSGSLAVAVDGCGVTTFALPLHALARGFAAFAAASTAAGSTAQRVVRAMTAEPHLVGGENRLCTDLMTVTGGRVIAKVGAEGVYCAATMDSAIGIALKVHDGARRAIEPALIGILEALGLLGVSERALLERYAAPPVLNTRGEVVGAIRIRVDGATSLPVAAVNGAEFEVRRG